jgi:hypothetical protein
MSSRRAKITGGFAMKNAFVATTLLATLVAATGCSFAARSPEMYRDDTAKLLDSKTPDIKACYDEQLKTWKDVAGSVRVKFTVKKETGEVTDAQVDPAATTAPSEVSECVIKSIAGLRLQPPDQNDGKATFTWNFTVESPPAASEPTG